MNVFYAFLQRRIRLGLLRHFEHSLNRRKRVFYNFCVELDFRFEVFERGKQFFGRVHQHILAVLRHSARCRRGDECLVGNFAAQAVNHFDNRRDDNRIGGGRLAKGNHFFGAANAVANVAGGLGHFGVSDYGRVGECRFEVGELLRLVLGVRPAVTVPQNHIASGLLDNPRAEVLVGAEDDFAVGGNLLYDVERVAAGADDVAERLDFRAAIYVGDYERVGVLFLEDGKLDGVAKLFECAARGVVGQDDRLCRIEDFRGLRHKIDARERDYVGVGFLRLTRQPERVAHVVGNLLDFFAHVIVRQNNGVAAFFGFENPLLCLGEPFFRASVKRRKYYRLHFLFCMKVEDSAG